MLQNFIDLINDYGCIPNGNRSYYLSRSQPPILALMVELLWQHMNTAKLIMKHGCKMLMRLKKSMRFGCKAQKSLLTRKRHSRRVVKMPCGGAS
ncbi:trehalase family glycosidase [Pseudoalteromonas sp. Hal099]